MSKNLIKIHKTVSKKYPNAVEELRGIADGSKVDYWRILHLNSAELRRAQTGCTTIAGFQDGSAIITHNEDCGSNQDTRNDCALVTYTLKNFSFTSFVYAGELAGSAYGWNSFGVFWSVNYLYPPDRKLRISRIPRDFTAHALTSSKDISAALRILRRSQDASGYHYAIGQGKRILSVEQWQDRISVKNILNAEVHSNHYIHDQFLHTTAPKPKSTRLRLKRASHLLAQNKNPLSILADRTDTPYAICRIRDEEGLTLSTVQFLPEKKRVRIYSPGSLKKEYSFQLQRS